MHKYKKHLLSVPQDQHFNSIIRPITLHKTCCTYITFLKWVVTHDGGSTGATRGCGTVSHFFSGLMIVFVFDILHIPSVWVQICRGCIAPTCTSLDTGLLASSACRLGQVPYLWCLHTKCHVPGFPPSVIDLLSSWSRKLGLWFKQPRM
jgi:hypothetical protein